MKLHTAVIRVCLAVLLPVTAASAQCDTAFVRHLSKEGLQTEHRTYLLLSGADTAPDSLAWLWAKYHLQYANDSLFHEQFDRGRALFLTDTLAVNFAALYFLQRAGTPATDVWFASLKNDSLPSIASAIRHCYQKGAQPDGDTTGLPEILVSDYLLHCKFQRKKPWVAATLSIVPGMGQLYLGKYRSFLIEFLTAALQGVQLIESVDRKGFSSFISIANTGFISAFYTAGIAGAYRDTRQLKNIYRDQFFHHACNYFAAHYRFSLY